MAYGPFRICRGVAEAAAFNCQGVLWQSSGGSFADPRRKSFQLDVASATVQASFDFSQPAKHEAMIRLLIISFTVLCMIGVALSLNQVIAGLVVSPLARLLPTVRQVMRQLREKFPTIEQEVLDSEGEEDDEVTAFEKLVGKITLIVAAANAHIMESEATVEGREWISGMARTPSENQRITSKASTFMGTIEWTIESELPNTPSADSPLGKAGDDDARHKLGMPFEQVDSWHFDVLSLEKAQLTSITGWLLLHAVDPELEVEPQVVAAFVEAMCQEYRDENPYHNWSHACDVHHVVFRECMLNKVQSFSSDVDIFALLVAAVAHDVGHPGVNNQFLVQTSHELALRYNDVSPLENMHCSTLFRVLSSKVDANIFRSLSHECFREARQVCVETILHTDNAKHFEMVKELQVFYHANSDAFDGQDVCFPSPAQVEIFQQASNHKLALMALLHGADISNACKPWEICQSWAECVLCEFFLQGDQEKELGIPIQMLNNRATVNKPSSQVAFIDIFVYPFNTAQVRIFPPLWEMSENLLHNLQLWQAMRTAEEQEMTGRKVQTICEELLSVVECARARPASRSPAANAGPPEQH